jgi:hypothetical protein
MKDYKRKLRNYKMELSRDGPRFGETEADFCLRFGLRGNRNFGSETEEEALRRSRAEHRFCGVSRKIFFSETQHTVVNDT